MSVGGVDGCTSDANGLRVSGSLGGKVGVLGKVIETFVVKCQGNQGGPANLPTSCK